MADEWFYSNNGQSAGPVSGTALREMAAQGDLKPTDMVWQEGMSQWAPAGSTRGLFASPASVPTVDVAKSAPPPPRQERPSRRLMDDYPREGRAIANEHAKGLSTGTKVGVVGVVVFVIFLVIIVGVAITAMVADVQSRAKTAVTQAPAPKVKIRGQAPPPVQQAGNPLPLGTRSYTVTLKAEGDEHVQVITCRQNELVHITVTVTNWAGAVEPDVDMFVEDPNGNEIAADDNPTKDCTVSFFAPQAGDYRVVVHLFSGSQITATVRY